MYVRYFSEDCCELCNEVIHNHWNCPFCKEDYAGTSIYRAIKVGDIIACEECDFVATVTKVEANHLTLEVN